MMIDTAWECVFEKVGVLNASSMAVCEFVYRIAVRPFSLGLLLQHT